MEEYKRLIRGWGWFIFDTPDDETCPNKNVLQDRLITTRRFPFEQGIPTPRKIVWKNTRGGIK